MYCNDNEEPSVLYGFPDINKTWTDILADPFNVSYMLQFFLGYFFSITKFTLVNLKNV